MRGLRQHDQLTSLVLRRCGIGDSVAREIAEYVRASKTLTDLNLEGNEIGDEGAAAIADALRANGALTKVPAFSLEPALAKSAAAHACLVCRARS